MVSFPASGWKVEIMRKMRAIFISVVLIFSAGLAAFAEDVSLRTTVDSTQLTLGNSTHLTITVNGAQKVDQIPLPPIDGFDARYLGPQTAVSIINGNYTSSKSFVYTLFPNKVGKFTVPVITFIKDGKEYKSDPIEISVEDAPAPTQGNEAKTSGTPTAISLQDKIMLTIEAPKKEVYLHEQMPLSIKLFFGVNISDVQYPTLDTTGFTKTNFAEPEQSQQMLNGMGFHVFHFKTFISPTREGELTIGPAQIQANLIYRSQNQNLESAFGADIFDNFFTSYERRQLTVNSEPVKVNVLPLPEEGKPEGFSGAVGKYEFDVTATPAEVKVGDPVTLRMKVSGEGDLKTITMPSFSDPAFKTYDPQIKDEGNTKILEQVIIPTSTDIKEVPSISFSYFDTESKQYRMLTRGPFPIAVSAPNPGDEFKAVGFETATPTVTAKEEVVGRDIAFIKEHLDDLRVRDYHIYKTWGFWLAVAAYCILWFAGLVVYCVRKRLKTDTRFARKFNSPTQVRQKLNKAKVYMHEKNAKEFYSTLIKTLTEYIGNQLHVPAGGLTYETIMRLLKDKKVPVRIIESIKSVFETADMVRFASVSPDEKKMKTDFEELKEVIERLEKSL